MNSIIIKSAIALILIIAAIQGGQYLFNYVDPWLSIGFTIFAVAAALMIVVNILKNIKK